MACRPVLIALCLAALVATGCDRRTKLTRINENTKRVIKADTIVVPDPPPAPPEPAPKLKPGVDREEIETTIKRRVIDRKTVP